MDGLTNWHDWLLCDVRPTPGPRHFSINRLHSPPPPLALPHNMKNTNNISFKNYVLALTTSEKFFILSCKIQNSLKKERVYLNSLSVTGTGQYNVCLTERLSISTLYLNPNINIGLTKQIPLNSPAVCLLQLDLKCWSKEKKCWFLDLLFSYLHSFSFWLGDLSSYHINDTGLAVGSISYRNPQNLNSILPEGKF